jgi:hypothetical protein
MVEEEEGGEIPTLVAVGGAIPREEEAEEPEGGAIPKLVAMGGAIPREEAG